jgi:TatD DNase family protein
MTSGFICYSAGRPPSSLRRWFTDSHCHLDHEKFAADLDAVLDRAADAGVNRILCIGTGDGPPELDRAIRLADRYPQIVATVGVHPHEAAKVTPETYTDLRRLGTPPESSRFGEIGLDYHYDFSPRDVQREVFIEQLKLARDSFCPSLIHTREAWDDTMSILRDHWSGPGILHCFTGDRRPGATSPRHGLPSGLRRRADLQDRGKRPRIREDHAGRSSFN